MKAADMHCDTLYEIFERRMRGEDCGILENSLHIDLKKMALGEYGLQNFAAFIPLERARTIMSPSEYAFRLIDTFHSELEKYPEQIGIVSSWKEIEENWKAGKMSAMLSMEEGGACEGKIEYLRTFYRLGVRMLTFTWNFPNELAWPNRIKRNPDGTGEFSLETEKGLTERGFEFLEEMERLGMIPDVSHLGDRGIFDVIAHAKKPFVASHSNARAVCFHVRNLSDEMIRGIAEKGGVIGMNFAPSFLRDEARFGVGQKVSVDDVILHIRHMIQVGGLGCVGLGSDFDGCPISFELKGAADMPLLERRLRESGFTENEIEHIFYRNVLRVYREVL